MNDKYENGRKVYLVGILSDSPIDWSSPEYAKVVPNAPELWNCLSCFDLCNTRGVYYLAFETKSDAEKVLRAFYEYGIECREHVLCMTISNAMYDKAVKVRADIFRQIEKVTGGTCMLRQEIHKVSDTIDLPARTDPHDPSGKSKMYECDGCGEDICYSEEYYDIDDTVYCKECFKEWAGDHKHFAY